MKTACFLLFFFLRYTGLGQDHPPIKNLVFEGAGIRGLAYCGAIQVLEEEGMLPHIRCVGGTSAGAITALALSLGYNATEIAAIINSTSFRKFNDGGFFFIGGISRLRKYYGWYKGEQFEKWLAKIIRAKTGNPDITFKELKEKGYKNLYVTGTSLTGQKGIVFSHEQFPNMKIRDAVRISMSIPLYFAPLFIDSAGGKRKPARGRNNGQLMVDGGIVANYPIRIFDSTRFTGASSPNSFAYNRQTIGFRIDSDAQIKNDDKRMGLAQMQVTNFKEYLSAFYTLIIESLNRQSLTEEDWERTVSISDGGIFPRIRKLDQTEVQRLIANGANATKAYLKK